MEWSDGGPKGPESAAEALVEFVQEFRPVDRLFMFLYTFRPKANALQNLDVLGDMLDHADETQPKCVEQIL